MMWPGAATCECDRARHATTRGAQPPSPLPSWLLPSPLISAIVVLSSSPSSPVFPPSAIVDATTAASAPHSSSSSHRLRPCLPAIVQPLLPLPSFSFPPTTSLVPSSVLTPDHLASIAERHHRLPPPPLRLSLSAVPAIHRRDLPSLSSPSPPSFPLSLFPSVHCTSLLSSSPPTSPPCLHHRSAASIAVATSPTTAASIFLPLSSVLCCCRCHNPPPLPCFARLLSSPTTLFEPGVDPPPFPNRSIHRRWHRCLPPRQGHDSISLPSPSPLHRRPPFSLLPSFTTDQPSFRLPLRHRHRFPLPATVNSPSFFDDSAGL